MEYDILVLTLGILALFILFVGIIALRKGRFKYVSEEKRAGQYGEQIAKRVIEEVLNENDTLLTNVSVSFNGKETEIDNVIVNNRGVFIIEVKNYNGVLTGSEDEFRWTKDKLTPVGNYYRTTVKNPIKQVKRQVYILSGFFKDQGIKVWVEGYAFLVNGNSPVKSKFVLKSHQDINDAIHCGKNNNLTRALKDRIVEILS